MGFFSISKAEESRLGFWGSIGYFCIWFILGTIGFALCAGGFLLILGFLMELFGLRQH